MRSVKFNSQMCPFSLMIMISVSLFVSSVSHATEVGIEFSATAVQKAPDRASYQSEMYIGKDFVRTDSTMKNTKIIEIQNTKAMKKYYLLPEHKVFMEVKLRNPMTPEVEIDQNTKPCDGMENTRCELLATESIFGRPAEKWEFVVQQNNQSIRSLHWIDIERRMIVREFLPNGTINELIPQGDDIVNQRKSEKWLWQVSGPNGTIRTSIQWYDPELKITTREEIQGGFVRELIHIKLGKQPKSLFDIPSSYVQVSDLKKYIKMNNVSEN